MPDFPEVSDPNDPGAGSPQLASPPGITNPDINPKTLKGRLPAVADEGQVTAIHNNFLNINRPRIAQLAQITSKYDGITGPYPMAKLKEVGSAWYSNFSTRALGSKADKVCGAIKMRVKRAPLLTGSSLPSGWPDGYDKSATFQKVITDTLRSWPKFDTLVGGAGHEVGLYGRAILAFRDQWTPWPSVYRTDKAFLPEGTEVGEWDVGMASIQEFYKPHELFDQIRDKDEAEAAGWDIENCVEAINSANIVPATTSTDVYMARTYQDLYRESTPGYSYLKGINVIEVIINYSTEYDGSVTQWIVTKNGGIKLFRANYPDQVMADFVMPWVFQNGNGFFYGSYGIGHLLYDLTVQMEKARNRVVDSWWNRTRFFAQVEPGKMQSANLAILDDYVFLENGTFAGTQAAYPSAVPDFQLLNSFFEQLLDNMIASYNPQPTDPKARPIAAQANMNEIMMDEQAIPTADMFLTQWARLMWMVQRRLCRDGNPVDEAKEAREKILSFMSEEELDTILKSQPYDVNLVAQKEDNERAIAYLEGVATTNDPNFNQVAVRQQLNTRILGPKGGEGLLLSQVDNTVQIEQTRQQMDETYTMSAGHQVPVSPRDGHAIHMAYLKGQPSPQGLSGPLPQAINTANQALQSNPPDLKAAQQLSQLAATYYQHYIQHFDFLAQSPGKKPWENGEKQFISQIGKLLQQINDHIAKAVQEQQAQAQPEGAQPPLPPVTPTLPKPGQTPIPGKSPAVLPGHPTPIPQ